MGFFYLDNDPATNLKEKKIGALSIDTLHKLGCKACPLNKAHVYSPKMAPHGPKKATVYLLGEAPGKVEDKRGRAFVGRAGKILTDKLFEIDRDWESYMRMNNTIRTRPPENRDPTKIETECCRRSIIKDIEKTKPIAIFGFGNVPLAWALGDKVIPKLTKISLWRGRKIPVRIGKHTCWYFPLFHPSFIGRQEIKDRHGNPIRNKYDIAWERDLRRAIEFCKKPQTPKVEDLDKIDDGIKWVTGKNGDRDIRAIKRHLKAFVHQTTLVVDFETSCLRPYRKGAKILSIAIGTYDSVFCIALDHKQSLWTSKQRPIVKDLIADFIRTFKGIFIAHQLAFEQEWMSWWIGNDILRDVKWGDTLLQAFVLDERKGMLSLDMLVLVHFGFPLKQQSSIDIKHLDDEPLEKVLLYNGLDAKYTSKLWTKQDPIVTFDGMHDVYRDQVRRIPTIVLTQQYGLPVNQKTVKKIQKKLGKELIKTMNKIQNLKVVKEFKETHAKFNPGSPKDMAIVFRDMLKRPEGKTEKGGYSTSEPVLERIKHPLSKLTLNYRSARKLKATYVDPLELGVGNNIYPDGLIHTTYNTTFTKTGRLSSDGPPCQNYPIRKNKYIRGQIEVPKDYVLVSFDYGQIEARVIAMASKDKAFMKALWEKHDVHMDWAEIVAHEYPRVVGGKKYIKDKEIMKNYRTKIKGALVFAAFFGAGVYSISESLKVPENIMKKIMDRFWKTFHGVKDWQNELQKFYADNGYVECLTGRRRHETMTFNELVNAPIQGTAADIVVDAMNRLSELGEKEGIPELQARLNVHDDLTFIFPEKNMDALCDICISEMLDVPFDFINVPLSIEGSMGTTWDNQDEFGTYFSNEWFK